MVVAKNNMVIDKIVNVNPYLTYTQIQAITDAVCKFDSWSEREQNIDILLLHFATDLTDEEIENYGHDNLIQSGLINEVKSNVKNYNKIYEAIEYTQSTQRALNQILKEMPKMMEPIKKVVERGKPSKK